jgi:hypothetical protein
MLLFKNKSRGPATGYSTVLYWGLGVFWSLESCIGASPSVSSRCKYSKNRWRVELVAHYLIIKMKGIHEDVLVQYEDGKRRGAARWMKM